MRSRTSQQQMCRIKLQHQVLMRGRRERRHPAVAAVYCVQHSQERPQWRLHANKEWNRDGLLQVLVEFSPCPHLDHLLLTERLEEDRTQCQMDQAVDNAKPRFGEN